jgi:hypothetical protein
VGLAALGGGVMSEERQSDAPEVVRAEDLSAEVDELMRWAAERGREARKHAPTRGKRAPVFTTHPDKADISQLLRADIQSALEDEVVPAVKNQPAKGILDWELERELAKKALVGLKLHTLKKLAEEMRLDKRGRAEEVAERIARAYKFDEEAIARLVLEHEDEPEPERGHSDRLFPTKDSIDLDSAEKWVQIVAERYIRVGIARWFVFEDYWRDNGTLTVQGTLRTYAAAVERRAEEPHLAGIPTEKSVELVIRDGSRIIAARDGSAAVSRAGARALASVTRVGTLGYVPVKAPADERLASLDSHTLLMLEMIHNRLPRLAVTNPNLTVARFRLSDEEKGETEEDRPSLKAVRFEGQHLLDSVQACQLIAREHRALVDLSLFVSRQVGEGLARLPVRIATERDHVLVVTGWGRLIPEESGPLHAELVGMTEQVLETGISDPQRLATLVARIAARASSNRPAQRPTILADDESDDGGDDE